MQEWTERMLAEWCHIKKIRNSTQLKKGGLNKLRDFVQSRIVRVLLTSQDFAGRERKFLSSAKRTSLSQKGVANLHLLRHEAQFAQFRQALLKAEELDRSGRTMLPDTVRVPRQFTHVCNTLQTTHVYDTLDVQIACYGAWSYKLAIACFCIPACSS